MRLVGRTPTTSRSVSTSCAMIASPHVCGHWKGVQHRCRAGSNIREWILNYSVDPFHIVRQQRGNMCPVRVAHFPPGSDRMPSAGPPMMCPTINTG